MAEEKKLDRRTFIRRAALGGTALAGGGLAYALLRRPEGPAYPSGNGRVLERLPGPDSWRPNVVLINADDLGYGDLSCYGSGAIETPCVDRLAREGMRFTDFHTCDTVCTPSRAGLLTGRYPARMMLDTPLHPTEGSRGKGAMVRLGYLAGRLGLLDLATRGAARGLHGAEITLPEALKVAGYRTGMVGKWHLGDFTGDPAFHPLHHGFDSYFGVPYSNDMEPLPLYRGKGIVEEDVPDQAALTGLYTEEAVRFIRDAGDTPFFLYVAHTFPHRPLHASDAFVGRSAAGLYGDVVEEVDWSTGRILEALEARGAAETTLVIFTSDNGPWYQGSPGGYRGRKGQAFEGGHRVPFIARAQGRIPADTVCEALAVNLDLFPTLLSAAGVALPQDRVIDGLDITSLLRGESDESPHDYLYLYHHGELEGIRWGKWKYLRETSHYVWPMPVNKKLGGLTTHTSGPTPLLFDLSVDPAEAYDLTDRHPGVVTRLEAAMARWEAEMAANPLGWRDDR